jgi:hypothetical protein
MPPAPHRRRWRRSRELPGRVLFGARLDYQTLSDRLAAGRVKRTPLTDTFGMAQFEAQNGPSAVPLFVVDAAGDFAPFTADHPPAPQPGQSLVSVVAAGAGSTEFPGTVPAPIGAV